MIEHPVDRVFHAIPDPVLSGGPPGARTTPERIAAELLMDPDLVVKAILQLVAGGNIDMNIYWDQADQPIEVWRHAS